ncbi:hypothetical protein FRC02_010934 [Tulasnella sp. 418]|nr:hypothetical protein FRC02_010934 [Tulasnella sp. 418]
MNSPPLYSPARRVKPLPARSKRRRMEGDDSQEGASPTMSSLTADESAPHASATSHPSSGFPHGGGLNFPMSYYLPIFAGQQANLRPDFDFHNHPVFAGINAANSGTGGVGAASDDDDHQDPDYQDSRDRDQQGNTKKRKVPSTHRFKQDMDGYGHNAGNTESISISVDPDSIPTKGPAYGFRPHAPPADLINWTAFTSQGVSPFATKSKKKGSPGRLLGLRLKDILKIRRRILSAVLGPVSLGDSLAIDQALAAPLSWNLLTEERPFAKEKEARKLTTPSRRRRRPLAGPHFRLPECEFSFACLSPTSERAVSLREEVAVLRDRFEGELARMATKRAIEMARKAAAAAKVAVENLSRDVKRSARKKSSLTASSNNQGTTGSTTAGGEASSGTASRTPKKKKRSALANASNPHHLRNYVPSRVPSGTATSKDSVAIQQLDNLLGPHPFRFLSADIKPRARKKDSSIYSSSASTVHPADEWICGFCEYNLFYGEDAAFRKAVKNRRKILIRRRRAKERAARAAAGKSIGPTGSSSEDESDSDLDPEDMPARFVDPAEVESRLDAGMQQILKDRDKLGTNTAGPPKA